MTNIVFFTCEDFFLFLFPLAFGLSSPLECQVHEGESFPVFCPVPRTGVELPAQPFVRDVILGNSPSLGGKLHSFLLILADCEHLRVTVVLCVSLPYQKDKRAFEIFKRAQYQPLVSLEPVLSSYLR